MNEARPLTAARCRARSMTAPAGSSTRPWADMGARCRARSIARRTTGVLTDVLRTAPAGSSTRPYTYRPPAATLLLRRGRVVTEITAGFTLLNIPLTTNQGGRLRSPGVMRKTSGALSCEVSGGDHETRNLVLWLCFSAAAVAVVCCVARVGAALRAERAALFGRRHPAFGFGCDRYRRRSRIRQPSGLRPRRWTCPPRASFKSQVSQRASKLRRKPFGHAQSARSPASRARPRRQRRPAVPPFRRCGPARISATPSLAPRPTAR